MGSLIGRNSCPKTLMAGNPSTHRFNVQSQQEMFLGGFVPGLSGNGAGFGLNRTFAS